jgi:hypothetical protein
MNPYRIPAPPVEFVPVDRQWLVDLIGPLWLVLTFVTLGAWPLVEYTIYEIIDEVRRRKVSAQ